MKANTAVADRYETALNILGKWRNVFTGWQLGTRAKSDPEAQAVSDQRELLLILRAEVNALSRLLIEKKIYSLDEYLAAVTVEADESCKALERRFPGFKATIAGLEMDSKIAVETTKGWKP